MIYLKNRPTIYNAFITGSFESFVVVIKKFKLGIRIDLIIILYSRYISLYFISITVYKIYTLI